MGRATSRAGVSDEYLESLSRINRRVSRHVASKVGINPRTVVAGVGGETFSVDISTGKILVPPPEFFKGMSEAEVEKASHGYLTHENGHRVAFPVTSYSYMAFASAVLSRGREVVGGQLEGAVQKVCNIVSDVLSDHILYLSSLGKELSARVPHLYGKIANAGSPALFFKALYLRALEIAAGRKTRFSDAIKRAYRGVVRDFPLLPRDVTEKVKSLLLGFTRSTEKLWKIYGSEGFAEMMIRASSPNAGILSYAVDTAVELMMLELQYSDESSSGGEGEGEGEGGGGGGGKEEGGEEGEGSSGRPGNRSGADGSQDPEGGDIEIGNITDGDVEKAVVAAHALYGEENVTAEMEALFSKKLEKFVSDLLNKLKVIFGQMSSTRRETGYRKKSSVLWLRPHGEPDEDSMLIEKHKLLWRVTYKTAYPKGRFRIEKNPVPEKLVILQDESGSTLEFIDKNFGVTVRRVEALISSLVLAGLRFHGGAKRITVFKFSDLTEKAYDGTSDVEAGKKIILPSVYFGGGTDIVPAVSTALRHTDKNSALVVVTDAVISGWEAKAIGKALSKAAESGRVGFVVFVIVNKRKSEAIEIIRTHLEGKAHAIVAQVSTLDDLKIVGNTITSKISRVYGSG